MKVSDIGSPDSPQSGGRSTAGTLDEVTGDQAAVEDIEVADAQSTPRPVRLADYRPPNWLVPEIELSFDLDAHRTRVTSRMRVVRNGHGDAPLVLDGEDLELVRFSVDGQTLADWQYRRSRSKLCAHITGDEAVVEIVTEIAPSANTQLMGLYASGGNLCTQCEAEGFRRITYFPDRPDVLSRYVVTLTADKELYPVLLANGNPCGGGATSDGRHWARWEDPVPKPCYLFALVAGKLSPLRDSFTTRSGRHVDLAIWVAEHNLPRCAHAMEALKLSMRWDEERYGREYDLNVFNIVAVDDFNFGAMENKGLNIFNSKYVLADSSTATDADFDAVTAVIAHEYFHNWTGNRITCRDWFQLSLKEGLTVYRDQEFSGDQSDRAVKRIEDVRALRATQFQEDAGPLAHPVRPDSYLEISNFYTSTVYNKGAEVIRMMATILGEERFRRGMDLYFERHDGQAVTVEDFVRAMEDASRADLSQFRLWYSQAGTPQVGVRLSYDEGVRTARVELSQQVPPTPGQPVKKPMHIPVRVALFGRGSGQRLGDEVVLELREKQSEFTFENIDEPPVLSVLRSFSAPVIVEMERDSATLALLSSHDDDPFARYEAMQRLALDLLVAEVESGQEQDASAIVEAIERTLGSELDPGFKAEAVTLPSESFVGDRMSTVQPDAIHAARERLRAVILERLRGALEQTYRGMGSNRYEASAEAKGRRKLKNVVLAYLCAGDDPQGIEAAVRQFNVADNMTDQVAALAQLVSSSGAERVEALQSFYDRFADDPLVLDKWFSIQALSTREDTLESVVRLAGHPDFRISNPNRARALIGAFSVNQSRFHDPSGAGYRFLADQVLALDRINPQTAARLVAPLGRWRRFDETRGQHMRGELERILTSPRLSKDVYEMASNSLS
jgi:aminopeptidase N